MKPGDVVMVPMTVLACNDDKSVVEGRIRWGEDAHETTIVHVMGMDCHPPSAGQVRYDGPIEPKAFFVRRNEDIGREELVRIMHVGTEYMEIQAHGRRADIISIEDFRRSAYLAD